MPLRVVIPPSVEPVTLAEAKLHLKVDVNDDDALISSLVATARAHAEMITQRSFISTMLEYVMDAFPGPSQFGVPWGRTFSLPGHAILLPKSPVQSVESIRYLDMDGTLKTMDPATYACDLASEPARITPAFGHIWPIPLPQIGAVMVRFIAGYGNTLADVPEGIKSWIKLRCGSLYINREEVAILNRGIVAELPFVDGLLDPYRVVTI
ncbi:MAG: phage head-tail connector protein [Magnetococcales bacterium]|nr:phage head-tail connector protein [Magnetococcales bacterium]